MRKECQDCIIYRSFPSHKGDCGDNCLLELDWGQVERDLDEYNRVGELRGLQGSANE